MFPATHGQAGYDLRLR